MGPRAWRTWLTAHPRRVDVGVAVATVAVSAVLIGGAPDASDAGWPDLAAGVGAFVLVLLRRRWPLLLLAVALGWAVIHALVWDRPSSLVFAALVLLATACVRLDRAPAITLGAGVGLTLYGLALTINDDLAPTDGRAVIGLVWAAAAVGIGDAARSWRRYRESVELQARSAVEAAEAERIIGMPLGADEVASLLAKMRYGVEEVKNGAVTLKGVWYIGNMAQALSI